MNDRVALAIGPTNSAGQAYEWACAVSRYLGVPAESFAVGRPEGSGPFSFRSHRSLGHNRWGPPRTRSRRLADILGSKSHVLVDGFRPLWGLPRLGDLRRDLNRLSRLGLRAGLISHGSDTRDPDSHMQRNPYSYFRTAPEEYVDALRRSAHRNRQLARESGLPWFVSTPDLLLDAPGARWLPLSLDPAQWQMSRQPFSSSRVRFLHVPSRRVPPIKGTTHVDSVLRELESKGALVYLSPDRVSHGQMSDLVEQADVVIDQIVSGFYGVSAVEAMAAGRVVIGSVSAETRALMPEDPPIIDASPSSLREVVTHIVQQPERFLQHGVYGARFVTRWHDGRASAAALTGFLGQGAVPSLRIAPSP